MILVDQRYMTISGFMLHHCVSFIFLCTRNWTVYVRGLQSRFNFLIWSTYRTFQDNLPAWPPDGYIMAIVAFLGLIFFHAVVLVIRILQIIFSRFQKLFLEYSIVTFRDIL